jgi:hypothetical protein
VYNNASTYACARYTIEECTEQGTSNADGAAGQDANKCDSASVQPGLRLLQSSGALVSRQYARAHAKQGAHGGSASVNTGVRFPPLARPTLVCRCLTNIQVGTSGTDKDHVVLNTGVQLQRIDDYSLTSLYSGVSGTLVLCSLALRPDGTDLLMQSADADTGTDLFMQAAPP